MKVPLWLSIVYTVVCASETGDFQGAEKLYSLDEGSEIAKIPAFDDFPEGWDAGRSDCPFENTTSLSESTYLENWHNPSIWDLNGSVPQLGEDVLIRERTRVLISNASLFRGVYGVIHIPASSELIFNDEEIHLETRGIDVKGRLVIGTSSCRIQNNIIITLHGNRTDEETPFFRKGIAATGTGILDIHGRFFIGWSRLAKTANRGDDVIYLQGNINWQEGQEVVVTGTEIKDSRDWHHNEVKVIGEIEVNDAGTFTKLRFTEPLEFAHFGGREYQAEVGLLTRNILIQGDKGSEPGDTSEDICSSERYSSYPCSQKHLTGFGGHIIAAGPLAMARISGVQAFRMGQTNMLGRYPFHFHLMGDQRKKSYFRDSSVRHSFFRCFTIHGTSDVLVSNNVAFDVIGHCYYLEDGVEERNTISFNLGAHIHFLESPRHSNNQYMEDIRQSSSLRNPADTTASAFYITNAYNRFVGNAASGGYSGYSFPRLDRPIKNFRYQNISDGFFPSQRPTLEFEGNTCHSSAFWWDGAGCIYVGGVLFHEDENSQVLVYNPGRDNPTRKTHCANGTSYCPMVFSNTKIFLAGIGLNHWGPMSEMYNLEVHDTQRPVAILGKHFLNKFLFNCRTSSGFRPARLESSLGLKNTWFENRFFDSSYVGFEFYDVYQSHILDTGTFRNCGNKSRNSPVWRAMTHSDRFVPQFMQSSKGIKYDNVDKNMLYGATVPDRLTLSRYLSNWFDADGSAFESGKASIIGNAWESDWWKLDETCTSVNLAFSSGGQGWWVCPSVSPRTQNRRSIGSFLMTHDQRVADEVKNGKICSNGDPGIPCDTIGFVNHFGSTENRKPLPIKPNGVITGPTGGLGWVLNFYKGPPVLLSLTQIQLFHDDSIVLVVPYPKGTIFSIRYQAPSWCNRDCVKFLEPVNSAGEVLRGNGTSYFFDNDKQLLFVKFYNQPEYVVDVERNINLDQWAYSKGNQSIPWLNWSSEFIIQVKNCARNPEDSSYCHFPDQLDIEQDACRIFSLEGSLHGFDECYSSKNSSVLSFEIVLVLACGGAVLVSILLGFLFWRRRKRVNRDPDQRHDVVCKL